MHKIYEAFNANPSLDVREVFLDSSKAFDRVWHDDLMYKLKCLSICGNYYSLIHSFLSDKHQRVVLNGQSSIWSHIRAGDTQGSILAPLLSLVYINNFYRWYLTFSVVRDIAESSQSLNDNLLKISRWSYQWKIIFTPGASKQAQKIIFFLKASATSYGTIYFNSVPVIRENIQKHLGLFLDSKLNFFHHINGKIKKATKVLITWLQFVLFICIVYIYLYFLLIFLCKHVLNYFFIPLRQAEGITWENFVPAKRDLGSTKEGSCLGAMELFTCNRRI